MSFCFRISHISNVINEKPSPWKTTIFYLMKSGAKTIDLSSNLIWKCYRDMRRAPQYFFDFFLAIILFETIAIVSITRSTEHTWLETNHILRSKIFHHFLYPFNSTRYCMVKAWLKMRVPKLLGRFNSFCLVLDVLGIEKHRVQLLVFVMFTWLLCNYIYVYVYVCLWIFHDENVNVVTMKMSL